MLHFIKSDTTGIRMKFLFKVYNFCPSTHNYYNMAPHVNYLPHYDIRTLIAEVFFLVYYICL